MGLPMMGTLLGIGLIVLALVLISRQPVGVRRAGGRGYGEQERQFQPAEIANGVLVLSEHYLRCDLPRRFGARVDQVYLTPDGILVQVDTKTGFRREVRRADLVELSVQASVLRHSTSASRPAGNVATWGYVRKVAPGRSPVYLRTQLLTDRELVEIYDRYWLVEGGAAAIPTRDPANCRYCPIAETCSVAPVRARQATRR